VTYLPAKASALSVVPAALAAASALVHRTFARRRKASVGAVAQPAPFDPASAPIEAIYQQTVAHGASIIGLAGVSRDSGVSSLARALARRAAGGGQRALLIDTSSQFFAATSERSPRTMDEGYFHLDLRPSAEERLPLREVSRLRKQFSESMREFDLIVVDMPPVLCGAEFPLPATIVANACDATMLVCMTGQTTNVDLQLALRTLKGANADPCGVIVNHREQPTLGAEIAREAERIRPLAPRLVDRVQERMAVSKFLDVHA
jgi:Mrp family chromosome partitioning ATPase